MTWFFVFVFVFVFLLCLFHFRVCFVFVLVPFLFNFVCSSLPFSLSFFCPIFVFMWVLLFPPIFGDTSGMFLVLLGLPYRVLRALREISRAMSPMRLSEGSRSFPLLTQMRKFQKRRIQ